MEITVNELLQIYNKGQIEAMNQIIAMADKHIYYSEADKRNYINGDELVKDIKIIRDVIKYKP